MDPSRFARIKDVLVQAMEMDEAEREAYLSRLAQDDGDLVTEVRALLEGSGETPDVLDATAASRWMSRTATVPNVDSGSDSTTSGSDPLRIGRYDILGRLGAGGMGQVFRARQTEPVDREVALKLLRGDTFSPAFHARFEHERQNLALMEHPNIARILDAGEDEAGRPYLVMDLVRGTPITEFCEDRQLGLQKRVQLFLDVCRAVQHAHHKGVIHRDIKPSNILVEELDGQPAPKVIDFGIAKLEASTDGAKAGRVGAELPTHLSPSRSTPPPVTRAGQLLGTLEYMSPEQADGRSTEADGRSDVFQLGVTLFEILTGRHPLFSPDASIQEKWKALRAPVVHPNRIPGNAAIDGEHDLFLIVQKSMARSPEDRYPTPNALAEDLDRWLRMEPIRARPASYRYTARRWTARNPLAAAGIAVAAVVAVAFGVTVTHMLRLQRQETLRAERALQRAEQAQDFLLQTLSAADPETGDPDLSVRDAIDLAASSLPAGELTDPELNMRLHWTLGDFHLGLSDWDEAVHHYEQAGEQAERHFGARSPESAEGIARLASALLSMEKILTADSLARASLAIRRDNFGVNHKVVGRGERLLGEALTKRGELDEAESHIRRAIDIFERTGTLEDLRHVRALSDLAFIRQKQGRLEEALELVMRSIEIKRRLLGQNHVSIVVHDEHNLGFLQSEMGKHELAVETMTRVLETQLEHFGETHSRTAVILENLARERYRMQEQAAAESLMAASVQVARDLDGDGTFLSFRLANSAFILYGLGQYEQALKDAEDCLRLRREAGLEDHHVTAVVLTIVADIHLASAENARARQVLQSADAIRERIGSPLPPRARVWMRESLAASLTGDAANARSLAEKALAVFVDQPEASRFPRAFLGMAAHLEGDFAAAREHYRTALATDAIRGHRRLEIETRLVACLLDTGFASEPPAASAEGGRMEEGPLARREVERLRSHADSLYHVPDFLLCEIEMLSAVANLRSKRRSEALADLDQAGRHVPPAARRHYESRIELLRALEAQMSGQMGRARELLRNSRAEILRRDVAIFGFDWALGEAAQLSSSTEYADRQRRRTSL